MTRLLVVNCSAKKAEVPAAKAIDLYVAPWITIINKALASGIEPTEVYILSGKYGLIHSQKIIARYDHKADPDNPDDQWLIEDAYEALEVLSEGEYSELYIGVMSRYSWILPEEWQLREWFPNLTIRPSMQLGHGFHHMQEWLYGRAMTEDVSKKNRLLIMGAATAPSQIPPKAAWDAYNTPSFKALREVRDAGIVMPRILILTSSGPITPESPIIPSLHKAIKDGDRVSKNIALSAIRRIIKGQGAFDEVYLDKFPGVDYVFANPQQIFGEAKIVRSSGKAKDLSLWLRGEPPISSIASGKRSTTPPWAQPLDKSVRPYRIISTYDHLLLLQQMENAYREGYRLFKFQTQWVCIKGEGEDEEILYTATMAMPQACLF